ncbi:hypothetical protein WOLCODRAFT_146661 [Wolfiporia cocos MD-104 SS10]|uniref:Uncharacterized protein n=1 Tax=Wolfiporia cocos (strain MD-104) TaxID=742152 RepID=A0A2H3J5G2_WOLCO|nr:hypothetical protein WOLCODRAFT_146661 [Wolfiporia cocos MD-104 SS10]
MAYFALILRTSNHRIICAQHLDLREALSHFNGPSYSSDRINRVLVSAPETSQSVYCIYLFRNISHPIGDCFDSISITAAVLHTYIVYLCYSSLTPNKILCVSWL